MKFNMKLLSVASVVVLFSSPVFATGSSVNDISKHSEHTMKQEVKSGKKYGKKCKGAKHEYLLASQKMHHAMMFSYSGDADVDFVRGMIPHHQGAIDMARIELKYGKDESLKELAKRIILAQEEEIGFMQNWLRGRNSSYKASDADSKISTVEYKKTMEDMHKNMSIKYTGNADVDFATGMIPHHQGAIDMAWVAKKEGVAPELREMLDNVIISQGQEIELMKDWLSNNKK